MSDFVYKSKIIFALLSIGIKENLVQIKYKSALNKIFQQRVRDDLIARIKSNSVPIEDKIAWMDK